MASLFTSLDVFATVFLRTQFLRYTKPRHLVIGSQTEDPWRGRHSVRLKGQEPITQWIDRSERNELFDYFLLEVELRKAIAQPVISDCALLRNPQVYCHVHLPISWTSCSHSTPSVHTPTFNIVLSFAGTFSESQPVALSFRKKGYILF
jgi:hypothetical protein